jgi:hypothetical protein
MSESGHVEAHHAQVLRERMYQSGVVLDHVRPIGTNTTQCFEDPESNTLTKPAGVLTDCIGSSPVGSRGDIRADQRASQLSSMEPGIHVSLCYRNGRREAPMSRHELLCLFVMSRAYPVRTCHGYCDKRTSHVTEKYQPPCMQAYQAIPAIMQRPAMECRQHSRIVLDSAIMHFFLRCLFPRPQWLR